MEQDYSVTNLHVQDIAGVDTNFQPTTTKRVTFNVGRRGPFYKDFKPGEYTAEAVTAAVAAEIATLKAIDAATHTMYR